MISCILSLSRMRLCDPVAPRMVFSLTAIMQRILSLLFVSKFALSGDIYDVKIETNRVVQVVDDKFVGVTLDSNLIREGWHKFDFKSEKLLALAQGLSPCYLRVGGTAADLLIFNPEATGFNTKWTNLSSYWEYQEAYRPETNFTMSRTDWDLINKFSSSVGWSLIFDFNVLLRKQGRWDPTNAEVLLNYTVQQGYKIPGFQLGNEPNAFHHVFDVDITASQLAQDFFQLEKLLRDSPSFHDSLIVGPDTTQVNRKPVIDYFKQFLSSGGGKVVNKASFHHYYVNGRTASVDDFLDASILDSLKGELTTALSLTDNLAPGVRVWLGETSSAYGGGAPGLSDAYVAGFMWLDKLGLCARSGLTGVMRQSFYKGNYALLDNNLDPRPDYWLTLLYKRLVGVAVLNVTTTPEANNIRLYAHCTNTHSLAGYPAGSVTLYGMNLQPHNITISLPTFTGHLLHVYWLSSSNGLKSREVQLNGRTLKLVDKKIPDMEPVKVSSSTFVIPAQTFGFIVIPDADVAVCQKNWSQVNV